MRYTCVLSNMANMWVEVFPPERRHVHSVQGDVGPKNMPSADAAPITYFLLMFTTNLLRTIVRETNRYATQFIRANRDKLAMLPHSRAHKWISVSLSEMKAFLAVVLNMGLIKKPSIEHYWRKCKESQNTCWFRKMFIRNRFQSILKFLHVVNNENSPGANQEHYNLAAKFKPVLDHFNMRTLCLYLPRQQLSVDESLVATKARSVMTQYIPSKKSKFGIKLWMLVESVTGFVMRIICYRGRQYDPVERGHQQGTDVVFRLLSECNLLQKYYHVYCYSFFTSLRLATDLLPWQTYLTGTLRQNRPMPNAIKNANLRNNESKFMRNGELLCRAYKDDNKKPVRLVTTYHSAKISNNRSRKPKVVQKYNNYMGGVDLNDMLTSFYPDERKTVKMWKKVFFNLLHRFVINAYLLYKQNAAGTSMSRLRFMEEVIESLSREHLGNRWTPVVGRDHLRRGKSRDCSVCSRRAVRMRKRTKFSCTSCRKAVHPLCLSRHRCVEI